MFASVTPQQRTALLIIIAAALIIRATTFFFFIQHNERYKQPDSNDYHVHALSCAAGTGMHQLNGKTPFFWRTPGYPVYVGSFYRLFGLRSVQDIRAGRKGVQFNDYQAPQKAAILTQIFLCSLTPLLVFALIYSLTMSAALSLASAAISAVHLGYVLASTYLLTEGIAILFFYLFLIFFFQSFALRGQRIPQSDSPWRMLTLAALMLGIMTWIRPMGEMVAIGSILMILILDRSSWLRKLQKCLLFGLLFFATLMPWYMRNHALTGKWFFCPIPGTYCITFSAPKIIRRTTGLPLEACINMLMHHAHKMAEPERKMALLQGKVFERRTAFGAVAFPILRAHPWWALQDWMKEVAKTVFDLYASQLAAIAAGTQSWDPVEEFLTIKLAACLYAQPMPLPMRMLCWLEFVFSLLLWIGIAAGACVFWLYPIIKKLHAPEIIKQTGLLWLKIAPMIGMVVIMTGGFGYARLRLPIEPLLVLLSLTFWRWFTSYMTSKEASHL